MGTDFITCINPATLEEFAKIPVTHPEKVAEYVSKAREAHPAWARLSYSGRAGYLLKARRYLLDNIDAFAKAITQDNGKPLIESVTAEIYPVAELIYYFAKRSEKILRPEKIPVSIWRLLGRSSYLSYQPYGVAGIISPWNYPFSIPVGTAVMALMAGNCVLLKPSSATAYIGQKIEELFSAAGLPKHVFTHLPGTSRTGEALIESGIDKIFFTGSTEVGRHIMQACSERLTPCNLELGGKDPMIVFPDADLEHATGAAVWGAYTNAGQCCASIERVYLHRDIASKFIDMVVRKASGLKVGPGIDPETDIGPLTTESQLKTVEEHVKDARARGAEILTGGVRPTDLKGYFYKPAILTGVNHSFKCMKEETFGPLMPIMTFSSVEEAAGLANDTPYGLSAYIWSGDIRGAKRFAKMLRCGTVCINECIYTHALPQTPWGGVKASGFGRTHGAIGLREMVEARHIHINRCTHFKDIWWYHYNGRLYRAFRRLSRLMTGSLINKLRAMPIFLTNLLRK